MPLEPNALVLVLTLVIAVTIHRSCGRWGAAQPLTIVLILCAAGALGAKLRTKWVAAPILERSLYAATVTGVVEYIQPRNSRGPRITLTVRSIKRLTLEKTPRRIRVRFQTPLPDLKPGQLISFKATLTPPAAPALPGGYDFGRAAFYQSLGAVGFAIGKPVVQQRPDDVGTYLTLLAMVQTWRQQIGARIIKALPGQTGAIANALMTGERGQIERSNLQAYRDAGLLHLLSISGLHMAIMAGSVFFALRLLLANIQSITLRYAIKKWAAFTAILAAFAYLMISGSTHATIRACVMVTIIMAAIIMDRPGLALRNVAIAGMAILIVAPESLLHVGFQMSFAAVIALIAFYEAIQERRSQSQIQRAGGWPRTVMWFIVGIVGTTIIASIAVAPIAAFHFHKSQQYSVLANLIAVPVCNLVVMPAALLAFLLMPLGLEALPLKAMGQGIDVMTWCAKTVAALPGAVSRLPSFSTTAFGLIVMGGLWLCLWQRAWRWLGIVLIAAGIAYAPFQPRPNLLVGRDGKLVALRDGHGQFNIIYGRRTKFELEQWLAHDGDNRQPSDIRNKAGFRCDRTGCTARLATKPIAISRHPASLRDDCTRSTVLILPYPEPAGCASAMTAIWDFWDIRKKGTHAYYIGGNGLGRLHTVADDRGNRPWSRAHYRSRRRSKRATRPSKAKATRLGRFAAIKRLRSDSATTQRPEVEGDDFAFDRF